MNCQLLDLQCGQLTRVHTQIIERSLEGIADLPPPNLQMARSGERPGQVIFDNSTAKLPIDV